MPPLRLLPLDSTCFYVDLLRRDFLRLSITNSTVSFTFYPTGWLPSGNKAVIDPSETQTTTFQPLLHISPTQLAHFVAITAFVRGFDFRNKKQQTNRGLFAFPERHWKFGVRKRLYKRHYGRRCPESRRRAGVGRGEGQQRL